MKSRDMLKLSVNSIMHRQLRSWLTLLGIIIGVAAVVAIISVGEGTKANVESQMSGFGADLITISPGGNARAGSFGGDFRMPPDIAGGASSRMADSASSASTKTPILTKTDSIMVSSNQNISAVNELVSGGRLELVFGSQKSNVSVQGVNPITWAEVSSIKLASGRFLSSGDSSGIVVGDRIANSMFKQPLTLGKRVAISDKTFVVVGILAASGQTIGGNNDSSVFMTHESAWSVSEDVNQGNYSSIQAKVKDIDAMDSTVSEITQSLMLSRRVNEKTQDFSISSSQAIKEQVSSVTETLTLFLGAIAAISLLVGAIGVANSMFTSVLEKTKHIGILKALGSTDREIMLLFVMESGIFGLFGGIIGVILGTMASVAISLLGIVPMTLVRAGPSGSIGSTTLVSPELIIIAIALSTVIGILAGAIPAKAASRMNPIDALRYE